MARSSGWLVPAVLAACTLTRAAAEGGQTPAGQASVPASVTILQGARVTQTPDGILVALDASGPLPFPAVGTAQNPPRIYIDLPNVRPAARLMSAPGTGVVRRIRAAVNSPQPLVTRVVIDLETAVPYQVDIERREEGRMSIAVESGATPGAPLPLPLPLGPPPPAVPIETSGSPAQRPVAPVPALPSPPQPGSSFTPFTPPQPSPDAGKVADGRTPPVPPPPMPTPSKPPTSIAAPPAPSNRPPDAKTSMPTPAPAASPPLPALTEDARKYAALAASPLRRLHDLQPLLDAIDRRAVVPMESLELATTDLRDIRADLLAVQPPRSIKQTHDTIFRGCSLALQAVSARLEAAQHGNTGGDWTSASAAAGAIMLIQRGRAELGQPSK